MICVIDYDFDTTLNVLYDMTLTLNVLYDMTSTFDFSTFINKDIVLPKVHIF